MLLGVVCTAVTYLMFVEGLGRIRVQHASILGYLEPVSAPVYALVLLGERPTAWTLAGGALILGAGAIIAVWGTAETEPAP